jgi:23S rRNA (guanosine2251-2'-O)-methyltransferase
VVEKDVTHRREHFPRAPAENAGDFIFGRHPVLEALRGAKGPAVNKLWLQRGSSGAPVEEILRLAREAGVVFQWVDRGRLDQMAPSGKHQGVVARVSEFSYASLEDVLSKGTPSPLILLDGVEDPHNLGAVLRNAAFLGAPAVIVPRWRSAGLSGAAVKASAGAAAVVPVVQVANAAQTILELKEKGYWVYGADADGRACPAFVFQKPMLLVLGAEGSGLHRLVKERCDELVSVPGPRGIDSMNVSCASAVLLYEILRQSTK